MVFEPQILVNPYLWGNCGVWSAMCKQHFQTFNCSEGLELNLYVIFSSEIDLRQELAINTNLGKSCCYIQGDGF